MAARTKPAPETEAEPTEEPKAETDDGLTEKVTAIVKDVLAGMTPETPEVEIEEPAKPETARQEEARAESLVSELVREFKDALKGEAKPEKKDEPTEQQPGKKATRWIEKHVWGVE